MATVEQVIRKRLDDCGMFGASMESVIEKSKTEIEPGLRWGSDSEGYPPALLALVWISVKEIALKWIDENHPHAFYRSLLS